MRNYGYEKWKKIKFKSGFNSNQNYQISNFGRVRNILSCGAIQVKKPILYQNQLIYRFTFPEKLNDGVRLKLHQKASHLVAKHFCKNYFKGCYVVWEDYNKLNNYYKNLLCLEESPGRSHAAKGRYKNIEQVLVLPKEKEDTPERVDGIQKIEIDDAYYKRMPAYPNYEINRYGEIRRFKSPFKGRIMKQRLHPDKFYFLDLIDKDKKRRTVYPHKEVAKAWNINIDAEHKTVVVHKDGNTLNNHSDNLEWMTPSEAIKLQFKHKKKDNYKVWETRKKRYGNGFKSKENVTSGEEVAA